MKQHTITIIKINSPKAIKVWSPCSTMSSTHETYSGRIRFHSHGCRRWQEHSSGFTLMRTNLQNRYGITRILSQSFDFNEVHLTVKKGGPSQAPRHVRTNFFFLVRMCGTTKLHTTTKNQKTHHKLTDMCGTKHQVVYDHKNKKNSKSFHQKTESKSVDRKNESLKRTKGAKNEHPD